MDVEGFVMLLAQILNQIPARVKDKDENVGITLLCKEQCFPLFQYFFKSDQEHSFINAKHSTESISR